MRGGFTDPDQLSDSEVESARLRLGLTRETGLNFGCRHHQSSFSMLNAARASSTSEIPIVHNLRAETADNLRT
ncbi:hypothetical protein PGT21_027938 [Puccinia graminis f. sp. tritici]|uniref:Uncharacterized protein n=1 Tax=Puccinia graminis f. sp. tritici TaxID=56615 RepID=A0A5B0NPI8_PUCGR|nr:hypothetical protein PGTUg99_019770 [Puccinia graminis f. sp. tritici]KAA1091187.1 hypothetical protein PGT21_027938 [Puccinia graminis f. sp. tritici]